MRSFSNFIDLYPDKTVVTGQNLGNGSHHIKPDIRTKSVTSYPLDQKEVGATLALAEDHVSALVVHFLEAASEVVSVGHAELLEEGNFVESGLNFEKR